MSEPNMAVIVGSFVVYTLFIIGIGVYSSKFASRSDEDYFLAGRSLGPWVAALSASASAISGWITMGVVGMAFANGFRTYWLIPGVCLGYAFNWFVLAARLRDRSAELGALTLPDLFSMHFKERIPILRVLSVLVILVAMLLYVASQFAAAGTAFAYTLPAADYWHGVLIGGAVVLAYTVLGGFRAACWTDFIQALVMIGAMVGFPIYILITQGGYGFIAEQFEAAEAAGRGQDLLNFMPQKSGLALVGFLLGSSGLGINFGYPGQPHVLVRYMAMRDRKDFLQGGIIALVWMFMILWGAVTIGLLARAMAEGGAEWGVEILTDLANGNPENLKQTALIAFAANALPGVVAGMVLAAVLAAICSTADSQLVVAASSVANDLYAKLFAKKSGATNMFVNRLTLLLLGFGAVALVIKDVPDVYSFVVKYGWAILGAAFGPQLILLLFWKKNTYAGCVVGMLVGFVLPVLWTWRYTLYLKDHPNAIEIYNLPLSFMAAMILNVLVSLATQGGKATPD
ncbi:MAG: sodium/proline symporter [Planctomycetota bacterium]|nr:sodium/proline symporter [Planctomycetota bacterium]